MSAGLARASDGFVVGVDLGTSMVKVGIYTLGGELVGMSSAPIDVHHLAPGHTEQDLNDFYRVAARVCRRCVHETAVAPAAIRAVAFAAQMAGVGVVDAEHSPLAPFDSWLDNRCGSIVEELEPHADAVIASAGCAPTISIGPKMLWWQRHHAELLEDAASFVTAAGFVAAVACGRRGNEAFIDPTHLHFATVGDVANSRWNEELVDLLGVDERLLPPVVESTETVGRLTASAAADFGLRAGTPIAAGCGDTAASALGAGALESGVALDVAGTAAVFAAGTDAFIADIDHHTLLTMRAPLPGRWYALAYVGGAGQVVEWVCREILGFDEVGDEAYLDLDATARAAQPGCDGLVLSPHFDGRVTPPAPNMRGSLVGLSLAHGRADLVRAAFESIAFEYRTYLDIIQGLQPDWKLQRVVGAGGGSHSGLWNQIKADVLGAEYAPIVGTDPGTRGAALVAIASLGDDLPALSESAIGRAVNPDPTNRPVYDRMHDRYSEWSAIFASAYRNRPVDPLDRAADEPVDELTDTDPHDLATRGAPTDG